MPRLIRTRVVEADMAAPGPGDFKSIKGAKEIAVFMQPGDVATTGWTVLVWFVPERDGDFPSNQPYADSLDVQSYTVDISGADLAAQQVATSPTLIFEDPQADEIYVQIKGMTGTTKVVWLTVKARD